MTIKNMKKNIMSKTDLVLFENLKVYAYKKDRLQT